MKKCFKNTLFKILQKYGKNVVKTQIQPIYGRNKVKIQSIYGRNKVKIQPIYGRNMVKICQIMVEIK